MERVGLDRRRVGVVAAAFVATAAYGFSAVVGGRGAGRNAPDGADFLDRDATAAAARVDTRPPWETAAAPIASPAELPPAPDSAVESEYVPLDSFERETSEEAEVDFQPRPEGTTPDPAAERRARYREAVLSRELRGGPTPDATAGEVQRRADAGAPQPREYGSGSEADPAASDSGTAPRADGESWRLHGEATEPPRAADGLEPHPAGFSRAAPIGTQPYRTESGSGGRRIREPDRAGPGIERRGPTAGEGRRHDHRAATPVLRAGTVIAAVLSSGVDSDLPGSVRAQVTRDVYDGGMRDVLLPRGTLLVGSYESRVRAGQQRLMVSWNAARLPNGVGLHFPALPSADPRGAAGIPGRVDRHSREVFGDAARLSLLSAALQIAQPEDRSGYPTSRQRAAAAASERFSDAAAILLQRNAQIGPTVRVAPGTSFVIVVPRDVPLEPVGR